MLSRLTRGYAFLPREVVIVAAKRTPIGSFMGSLSAIPAPKLGAHAIKAALNQAKLKPNQVSELIFGNVLGAGVGQSPARQAAIFAGLPNEVVCTGVNKVCSSGMKAITFAAQGLALGHSDVVVAGGMENMSLAPFMLPSYRTGQLMGDGKVIDSIVNDGLLCPFNNFAMGACAERTNVKYEITREHQDTYCIKSYERSSAAWKRGFFNAEVEKMEITTKKGTVVVEEDEEYKKVNFEKIPTLKPVFEKSGSITPANASKINDGACALILMTRDKAREMGVKPIARILSFADNENEPIHFAVAPKEAMLKAIDRAGIGRYNVGLYEVNEAFSLVPIVSMKLIAIDHKKINVNGGAVSLGHPLGMSGARIVGSLIYALRENNQRYGVAGICNGGGGGTAIVIEVI
ncbi:hypothetical protein SteCoe_33279 [Stentor coeruleus]|uniref:acetyl-CoA C-acetyltransferase n=1 Tax=Stentor coeruleus TaxID=5963 RepID=A0A1R2AX28_9CILI|nr:hypothetical protein SteCoe_33279 [Stentor coeruleus]